MEISVLEKKKGRLIFELHGAHNTVSNSLRDELWNDKKIKVATYSVKHPLTPVPRFIIETEDGADPIDAVVNATKRLQKRNKELLSALKKV